MIRSAPHNGEFAVNASIDSSGSKLIQHWRRKYSDGSSSSHRTSHSHFFEWWARRSSQGTSHPPLASRKRNLVSGKRSQTPPVVMYAIECITSTGLAIAWVKRMLLNCQPSAGSSDDGAYLPPRTARPTSRP